MSRSSLSSIAVTILIVCQQLSPSSGLLATKCAYKSRTFSVTVEHLKPFEEVYITGNAVSLGEWKWERIVPMKRLPHTNQFSAEVLVNTCEKVQYRYLLAVHDQFGMQIRKIEVPKRPRISNACKLRKCSQKLDTFGDRKTAPGFLTTETRLQLNFVYRKMFKILNSWKFQGDNIRIKIIQTIGFHPANCIEVSKQYYGHSKYRSQSSKGVLYQSGNIVSFQLTSHVPTVDCYKILFHNQQGQHMAETDLCTSQLTQDQGKLELHIYEPYEQELVAILTLPYLIVRPYFKAHTLDLNSPYAHTVPIDLAPLYVGHRGNGANFNELPTEKIENTIESYLAAVNAKVDMVEVDVQVSRDGIPFIAHDFEVLISSNYTSTPGNLNELQQITLNKLNYQDIKNIRLYVANNEQLRQYPSYNEEVNPGRRLFNTLRNVFNALPEHIAFDLDIKTPQTLLNDSEEGEKPEDLNSFVDAILEVALEYSCKRIIVISCFDANTCALFAQKQNKIPVLFLTMGYTVRWSSFLYKDERTRSLLDAMNFADVQNMAGVAPSAEEFNLRGLDSVENYQFFQQLKNLDQISLMWGEECNSQQMIAKLFEWGANAVCFDGAEQLVPKTKKQYFFENIIAKDSVCPLPRAAVSSKRKMFGFKG